MPKRTKRVFILGGGAALGAHHVGALKYLEEQGIRPDVIIASSIGVINACTNRWLDFMEFLFAALPSQAAGVPMEPRVRAKHYL